MRLIPLLVVAVSVVFCGKMGKDPGCDDGVTNIKKDWNQNEDIFACKFPGGKYLGATQKPYKIESGCDTIAKDYVPKHFCMNETIELLEPLPTHANHRPVWAAYGEYKFVPWQRWSHNIEHGAVVMLYNPCTKPELVEKLRAIVTGCLRKHVITSWTLVPEITPLALIAWGCRLKMSGVDEDEVKKWIKEKALQANEKSALDGGYNYSLIAPAKIVSDINDSKLCPK